MKFTATILLISGIALLAFTTPEVPAAVLNAFKNMFPNGQNVEWVYDDGQWEAVFDRNNAEMEAFFTDDGTWTETKTKIRPEDIPEAATGVYMKYPDFMIIEANVVRTPDVTRAYELTLKAGDHIVEMLVDPEGHVLKTVSRHDKKAGDNNDR